MRIDLDVVVAGIVAGWDRRCSFDGFPRGYQRSISGPRRRILARSWLPMRTMRTSSSSTSSCSNCWRIIWVVRC